MKMMKQLFSPLKRAPLTTRHSPLTGSGFTLIEVLVSLAILGIMAGIGISMFAIINSAVQKAETINRIQSEGSAVMEKIQRSIRSSTETSNNPADCLTAGGLPDECLHLTLPPDSIEFQEQTDGDEHGCKYVDYYYAKDNDSDMWRISTIRYNDGGETDTNKRCGIRMNLFSDRGKGGINVQKVNDTTPIFVLKDTHDAPAYVTVSFNLTPGTQFKDKDTQIPFITTTSLRDYTR